MKAQSRASVVTRQLVERSPSHRVPTGPIGSMTVDGLENKPGIK